MSTHMHPHSLWPTRSPPLIHHHHQQQQRFRYAFGILLWEVCTAAYPFKGISPAMLPHQVVKKGLRPSFWDGTPDEFVNLAKACWAADALER